MTFHPAVRASAVRDTLAFLDRFEPGARQRVLDRVPAAPRKVILETARSGWIGAEHDHYTIDAIVALFGTQRAIYFWCKTLAELSDKPLLKAFLGGMLKMMPLERTRVVMLLATGWQLVYRDMGALEVVTDAAGDPVLRFHDIPELVRRHRNYLHSWHGGCLGFVALSGLDAVLSFRVAPDTSSAEATFARSR